MIKKILKFLFLLFLVVLTAFFFLAGKIVDRNVNEVVGPGDYEVSQKAKSIHKDLLVADLHADNLLWDRDPTKKLGYGMVDIPRLIEGGYALQVFDAVIKTPKNQNYKSNSSDSDNITLLAMANRWPPNTWFSLLDRALYQAAKLKDAANRSSNLEMIYSRSDLEYFMKIRRSNSYVVAGILSVEGLHALEGEFGNIEKLVEAGYRMMGLVHFFDNKLGGSSAGVEKGGLTDFGKRIVRELEARKIIIDLAHASPELFEDVLANTSRPLVVSHTGVRAVHDSPRNLSDEQLRQIAERGGLVGIGFWAEAVGGTRPGDIAKAIRHTVDIIGIDHVALGSDFDGAVPISFDASEIIFITEALVREGFSKDEIKKIMGQNQIDFFLANLP